MNNLIILERGRYELNMNLIWYLRIHIWNLKLLFYFSGGVYAVLSMFLISIYILSKFIEVEWKS